MISGPEAYVKESAVLLSELNTQVLESRGWFSRAFKFYISYKIVIFKKEVP